MFVEIFISVLCFWITALFAKNEVKNKKYPEAVFSILFSVFFALVAAVSLLSAHIVPLLEKMH